MKYKTLSEVIAETICIWTLILIFGLSTFVIYANFFVHH